MDRALFLVVWFSVTPIKPSRFADNLLFFINIQAWRALPDSFLADSALNRRSSAFQAGEERVAAGLPHHSRVAVIDVMAT
jgi:hypothetical protein